MVKHFYYSKYQKKETSIYQRKFFMKIRRKLKISKKLKKNLKKFLSDNERAKFISPYLTPILHRTSLAFTIQPSKPPGQFKFD
jgi:hypothetical protein